MARSRLPKADRKNRRESWPPRGQPCWPSVPSWPSGSADLVRPFRPRNGPPGRERIQARVERIAESANRRRQSEAAEAEKADDSGGRSASADCCLEEPPPPRIVVAEELDYHVMAEGVPASVVAEIENHADRYPGTKIVSLLRRSYPAGPLAAHVLGHLGPVGETELAQQKQSDSPCLLDNQRWGGICTATPGATVQLSPQPPLYLPDDWVGRMGVERQYEAVLRGHHGVAVQQTDHSGHVLADITPRNRWPAATCG